MALILNEKQTALGFGSFLAVVHAAWAVIIASGYGKAMLDWIFNLHMLSNPVQVLAFNSMKAVLLVLFTFVMGAIFGWIFACAWNWAGKQKYF
jgi:hypothetical protein